MKETAFHKSMATQHEVFHGVQPGKKLNILKGPGNAHLCDVIRFFPLEFLSLKKNQALVWTVEAVDTIKEGCFARSIGSYDGKNGAFMDLEVDIYEGFQSSKGNGEVLNLEEGHNVTQSEFYKASGSQRGHLLPLPEACAVFM